jgi:nucleotide-binding universal stress UspA family protein
MFTHILVPTDFSEASDAALEYARAVAARFGSTLHLLHVVEAPFVTGPMGTEVFITESPAVQAELFEEAQVRLAARVTEHDKGRFHTTTEIVSGTTARTILGYASERGINLIVMGTHGRSGMAHLLMGSVAEKIVRNAPCPVLTVRQAPVAAELVGMEAAVAIA